MWGYVITVVISLIVGYFLGRGRATELFTLGYKQAEADYLIDLALPKDKN